MLWSEVADLAKIELPEEPVRTEPVLPNRLRARPQRRPFHVVLVEPEIPPNTGNVARLCAATSCALHLVGRLGFSLDEHQVRRAGLDYWPLVELYQHADLAAAESAILSFSADPAAAADRRPRLWFFSGKAVTSFLDVPYRLGDALVFGKESTGLSPDVLAERAGAVVGIPTLGAVRSLNLASAAAIAVYEALRQVGALEVVQVESDPDPTEGSPQDGRA